MEKDHDFLKPLDSIQRVDAPPFLISRIETAIEKDRKEWIAPKKIWAVAVSFVVLLLINMYAIRQVSHSNERNLAQVFQLMPDKNLYE
jgi:hypothetical protein